VIPKGLQSEATCSHAYVKGDSHRWTEADGVMIFNKAVLPGYSALFRHYNDDMYLGECVWCWSGSVAFVFPGSVQLLLVGLVSAVCSRERHSSFSWRCVCNLRYCWFSSVDFPLSNVFITLL
jgi:hypothetical protein